MRSKTFVGFLAVWLGCTALAVFLFRSPPRPQPPLPHPSPTPLPSPTPEPPPRAPSGLVPVEPTRLADDHDPESLSSALKESLTYLKRKGDRPVSFGHSKLPASRIRATVEAVSELVEAHGTSPELFEALKSRFEFFEAKSREVLATGYFLASLRGSRQKSERFRFPIYGPPKSLKKIDLGAFPELAKLPGLPRSLHARVEGKKIIPYFTREEIDFQEVLAGDGDEILFAEDLVDLHSLHVQGSGIVTLENGNSVLVGFADSNGRPFRGVGGVLLRRNLIPRSQASTQGVQAFLKANPKLHREILSENARYIFFEERSRGPLGSLGVSITPHRSIAIDPDFYPNGGVALLELEKPRFNAEGTLIAWEPFTRLVLLQDAGAAIQGPGRLDLYCGYGEENARIAGSMYKRGRLQLLQLKEGESAGP